MKISHRQMAAFQYKERLIAIANKLKQRIDKNPWPKNKMSHEIFTAICDELQWRRQRSHCE